MTTAAFRYRLPAQLGGGEYDGVPDGAHVLLDIPGVGTVPFAAHKVTRVMPEEPSRGWVCVQAAGEPRPYAFSRHDDPLGETAGASHWWWHDRQQWVDWPTVYGLGTPRRLMQAGILVNPGKGLCPECGRMKALRIDGLLSNHDEPGRRGGNRCKGSNQKPRGAE